jgi:hypothetical protein
VIPYGKMFLPGEVILVHIDEEPGFFALIERIEPDRKKGWWKMVFLVLAIPIKRMTWILDEEQLRGQPFTMNKVPIQLLRLEAPDEDQPTASTNKRRPRPPAGDGNVISMFDQE